MARLVVQEKRGSRFAYAEEVPSAASTVLGSSGEAVRIKWTSGECKLSAKLAVRRFQLVIEYVGKR
jgi:hypothetical protein